MKSILVLFFVSLISISNSFGQENAKKIIGKPEKIHELVDATKATKLIEQNKDLIIIDVRTPKEVETGKLPNAINIDFKSEDFEAKLDALDKNKPYLVYCYIGGRSNKAAEIMKEKGFAIVYDVKGGIKAVNELAK